ncbi:ABC transporter ATP-binding protein [Nocardioides dongxiaopingii]|uniref:ABC transporter ATP-binding protein n=1 Tax=Nocardioides sp. S-1144 TaxID=2582905 RepID=UPI00110E5513|nr:ABC transporter ATP-binding protein [Nocardioides sp. S-1144]QCW50745.1 ABC transporter ATP-binding protein [Nocardioides sp. S-1144]
MTSTPPPATDPAAPPGSSRLGAEGVTLAYDRRVVSTDLSIAVPDGSFTVIIGPNGCGKSTLLRALARLLEPSSGRVVLDGRAVSDYRGKEAARVVGLLPQTSLAPDGITVADLVGRGRYPHQGLIRGFSAADKAAVDRAMTATGVADLASRPVDELSGGQRQRVWVAMALAQETPLLLLDEPTTYLDIAHQIDLLDLLAGLHRGGSTLVAVLHDLNQATRYATHLVVMKDGAVAAQGPPRDIFTADLVHEVFGLPCLVIEDPVSGTPLVVPTSRGHVQDRTKV